MNTMAVRGGVTFQVYPGNGSSSSSSSSSSSENSDTRLKRFNRLLRTAVARHWAHFKKVKPLKIRGRSISDAGLCSIVDNESISDYLGMVQNKPRRSFQIIRAPPPARASVPGLSLTSSSSSGSAVALEEQSDVSDTERPRRCNHLRVPTPACLVQSTGNFASGAGGAGCGGPRSAPTTPLQLEPHPRPMKHEKQAVKPLSRSVPSVQALPPGQAPGGGVSDASEGKAPSKARQKKFFRHFPQVGPDERVLNYYSCALVGDILLQGHLYITKNYFAFYSNVFGYVTKLLIPTPSVLRVTKEKMARIIPNAVGVCTRDERHVFGSLLSRDSTYKLMTHVWKAARTELPVPPPPQAQPVSETEPDASEYSVEDETSSAGGDDATQTPKRREPEAIISGPGAAVIQPGLLTGTKVEATPRHSLTRMFLLVCSALLFVSALCLAHSVYRDHRDQGEITNLSGSELYSELVRWRARLHGRAATELQAFLSTNLLLLTKVRQSLETLSGVILSDMAQATGNPLHLEVPPNDTTFS